MHCTVVHRSVILLQLSIRQDYIATVSAIRALTLPYQHKYANLDDELLAERSVTLNLSVAETTRHVNILKRKYSSINICFSIWKFALPANCWHVDAVCPSVRMSDLNRQSNGDKSK